MLVGGEGGRNMGVMMGGYVSSDRSGIGSHGGVHDVGNHGVQGLTAATFTGLKSPFPCV